MPGPFFYDSPVPPKLDLAGARSQLFQVPQTPSASSSLYRSISNFRRKRPRYDNEKPLTDSQSELATSPVSLVNTDYRLAGGGDIHQTWLGRRETPAELDYRPNRYRETIIPPPIDGSTESLTPTELSVSGNTRKRTRRDSGYSTTYNPDEEAKSQSAAVSWSRAVINVVGKVWDFCWSGAFRGFYAGGGRGYDMTPSSLPQLEGTNTWQQSPSTEKHDIFMADTSNDRYDQGFLPGQYPEDEIQRNWVVVPNDRERSLFNDSSPYTIATKRAHRRSVGAFQPRRRSAMPRLGKRVVVSPGRPLSPIRNQATPSTKSSPVSVEAQRYAAQMRRMEREEDASLRRLNRQLQAMIKEGKEALGTRVEVEDLDFDDDL